MTDTVDLEHAWQWTCPACGRKNTTRQQVAEVTEQDLREAMGLPEWEKPPMDAAGEWYCSPDTVMCAGCAAVFKAREPGEQNAD